MYRVVQILERATPVRCSLDHYDKLGVLKLSYCTFSFSSPPFLCCQSLRFLWLDHCQDMLESGPDGAAQMWEADGIQQCFQRLWVLDVRYTCCDQILSGRMLEFMTQLRVLNVIGAEDWDMRQLQGQLPNICKLGVAKSTIQCGTTLWNGDLLAGSKHLRFLDLSGNEIISGKSCISATEKSCSLETIVIHEGYAGLEKISLAGCAQLENVLLTGSFNELVSLDISGSAVKRLDLSAMIVLKLDEIILLDCNMLRAILWPPEGRKKRYPSKLRIQTKKESSTPSYMWWYISVYDERLLWSLLPLKQYFNYYIVHVEISSPGRLPDGLACTSDEMILEVTTPEGNNTSIYVDVAKGHLLHVKGDEGDSPISFTRVWPCPRAPDLVQQNCYLHIQDWPQGRKPQRTSQKTATITIPDTICNSTGIIHVHDSLYITRMPDPAPSGAVWDYLFWCRVEHCPKMDCVFTSSSMVGAENRDDRIFWRLATLWVSQLPKARFIWSSRKHEISGHSFEYLNFVHVDFCPRLTHVLPLSMALIRGSGLDSLTTLEIVWCGDLRAVFPLDTDAQSYQDHRRNQAITVEFPSLERIHLHESPKLHGLCGRGRVYAPKLESMVIRGCWNLTRIPSVGDGGDRITKKVKCDCEKEWWDRLEWDGLEERHHPSLYEPTHPKYYKKTMLRTSVLR